jgi:Cu-Zn family superoxide dismutase
MLTMTERRNVRPCLAVAFAALLAFAPPVSAATSPFDADTSRGYTGNVTDWLLDNDVRSRGARANDPEALRAVAALFREGHPRASVALQNYFERHPADPAAFDLAGVVLLGEQKYEAAITSFDQAIALGAQGSWPTAKLGLARLLAGQTEQGISLLSKAIETDSANPLARRYLAWTALESGDLPRAIQHSEAALGAFGLPRGSVNRAHLDLAELYRRAHRHIDVKHLLAPVVNSPDDDLAPAILSETYGLYLDAALELRDPKAANLALERLRRLGFGDSPQFVLATARADLVEGNPEEAIAKLEALRLDAPEMATRLIPDLARAEAEAGRVEDALARLEAYASTHGAGPDLPILREAAALVLAKGSEDLASSFGETLLNAPEERLDVRQLGVEVTARSGHPDQALEELDALLVRAPDEAALHRLRGMILADLDRGKEAAQALRRALDLRPADPEGWLLLIGAVHGHEGYGHSGGEADHGEVETLLKAAIAANPDSAKLRTELGLLHLSDGDVERARDVLQEAERRAPGWLPALSLGALALADLGEDLNRASELIARADAMAPDTPITLDIMGWIALKSGDLEAARAHLDASLEIDGSDTTTLYHRAVLAEMEGELDRASDLYLRSLELGDTYGHYREDARAGLARTGSADETTSAVLRIGPDGLGEKIGTVTVRRGENAGVLFEADLSGLPAGPNAAHVHEHPTCASSDGVVGGAAGPHYGHAHVHMVMANGSMADMTDRAVSAQADGIDDMKDMAGMDHAAISVPGPNAGGEPRALPKGDLAPFVFDKEGRSDTVIHAPQLVLDEIRGRSLMIHLGPDENGQSGRKIACAVIR